MATLTDAHEVENQAKVAFEDFLKGFKLSHKGNLWRLFVLDGQEVTLTIFRVGVTCWSWCLAGPGGAKTFAQSPLPEQGDVFRDLWSHVRG